VLYQPFLDPRFPDRLALRVESGNNVRVDYTPPGKSRAIRFTMKRDEYQTWLDAVEEFAEYKRKADNEVVPPLVDAAPVAQSAGRRGRPRTKEVTNVDVPSWPQDARTDR
jgi:hypothetical protein